MRRLFFIVMPFFLLLQIGQAKDISTLLNELAKKDDLSEYTKKETAGFIKIFKREDLDRMKIKSFDELLDKIPFLKNKTDNFGYSDPYYAAYQPSNPSRVRLFINESEILMPLMGSGLRIFGQVDISYIDHIEVYHGIPSYEVAIEPSVVIIKAYTKVGKRENTTTIGTSVTNYGGYDAYAYKSEKLDDYSYFTYINTRNSKRDEVENLGTKLSRDKKTTHVYGQLSNETSNFEIQAMDGKLDDFAANSWEMTPVDSYTNFQYFNSRYSYQTQDTSLKAIFNYSYLDTNAHENSISPLNVAAPTMAHPSAFYNSSKIYAKEHLFDFKITKNLTLGNTLFLFGLSNRLKKFNIYKYEFDDIEFPFNSDYDTENVASVFTEIKHFIDKHNQIILSLNTQRYFENGGIDDETIYGGRLGHIYSKDNFTQKSFLLYGKFHPSTNLLLLNDRLSLGTNTLDPETAYSISTQLLFDYKNTNYSLLLGRSVFKEGIVFDGTSYNNIDEKFTFDSISFDGTYAFNSTDKLNLTAWTLFNDYGEKQSDRYQNEYGGSLSLYAKIFTLDTYNSISYVNGKASNPDGWNYNATITYPYSKQLSIFIKGKNLLNEALTSDYNSVNPITKQVTVLDNIANVDRTVWFGLEYKF